MKIRVEDGVEYIETEAGDPFMLDGLWTCMTMEDNDSVRCGCGWSVIRIDTESVLASLRFHYVHCPEARPRRGMLRA